MGTWVATNPDTGKKLKVTGESPPTEAEWDALFSESEQRAEINAQQAVDIPVNGEPQPVQPQEEMGLGDYATGAADIVGKGAYEAGKKSLEGLSMLGGFKGVGTDSMPASIANAQAMTAQMPEYEMGEDAIALTQVLSEKYKEYAPEIVKDVLSAYGSLGESVGNKVMDVTGSPLLATGARMIPDVIEAATTLGAANVAKQGAKGVASGMKAPIQNAINNQIMQSSQGDLPLAAASGVAKLIGKAQDLSPSQRRLKEQIKTGDIDKYSAIHDITPSGALVKNPIYQNAADLGVEPSLIDMTRRASPAVKRQLQEMVNIKRKGLRFREQGHKNRPEIVLGRPLLKRLDRVKLANRAAGKDIDKEAGKLKGQFIDFDEPVATFIDAIENKLRVTVGRNDDGTPTGKYSFKDSIIESNPSAQKLIKAVMKEMNRGKGSVDAFGAHELKMLIDDQVSYGKARGGLAGKAESIVKGLRHDIDTALDGKFESYDAVNSSYAETINIISTIQDLAGKKMDLDGPKGEMTAGILMRGIMQNNKGTVALQEALDELDTLAVKYGGTYDDNIDMLADMAVTLDRMFGASAKAGAQGTVEGGVGTAFEKVMPSQGGMIKEGLKAGGRKAKEAKDALFGDAVRDERLKLDALDDLLREKK